MAAYRSRFSVDGTALNISGVRWVNDQQKLRGVSAVSVPAVALPGVDGELALAATRTVGPGAFELNISVTGTDYADFLTNKTTLEALLSKPRALVTITESVLKADGSVAYTLSADAMLMGSESVKPWQSFTDGADLVYKFRIPSGVWYGPELSYTVAPNGSFSSFRGGSAPQYPVRVIFTPPNTGAINWRLTAGTDPGAWVGFDAPSTPGSMITVDLQKMTATSGGTDLSRYLDAGPRMFFIPQDGSGSFKTNISWSGFNVRIESRKAYY